jgi:hypothetical protein
MDVPAVNHPIWKQVIENPESFGFEFLAIKILVSKLKNNLRYSGDDQSTMESITELRDLFVRHLQMPKVKNDLIKIITKGIQL